MSLNVYKNNLKPIIFYLKNRGYPEMTSSRPILETNLRAILRWKTALFSPLYNGLSQDHNFNQTSGTMYSFMVTVL